MSNLNALRTTLRKLGTNAAQFFAPSVVRTRGGDSPDTLGGDAGTHSSVWHDVAADERNPDVLMPTWDTTAASDRQSAKVAVPVPEQDVANFLPPAPIIQAASLPPAEMCLDIPELDDTVITQEIPPASPVISTRLTVSPDVAAVKATPTAEQKAVARAPADERQLVIAGPGTGKTFTVIQRLEYLLSAEGLGVGQILVLSFSRSAVREIDTRLRRQVIDHDAHGDLSYLQVRTFDSFAYRLLSEVGKSPNITMKTYDEIISQAAKEIARQGSDAREIVAGLEHLIVDELQDLVGPRAALVKSMLLAMGGGFTLLGDPAQAIYDYQTRISGGTSSIAFLAWLRKHTVEWELQERTLSRNLRGSHRCFAVSERHRPALLDSTDRYRTYRQLKRDLEALPSAGCASGIDPMINDLPPGKTEAILCRSNNDALQIHMHLLCQGIAHTLAVNADETGLPAWVGRILSDWTAPDITKTQFDSRWASSVGSYLTLRPDDAWSALQRVMNEGRRSRRFAMSDLRQALARRPDLPNGSSIQAAPVTVSTIHRAKGREYDQVLILDSPDRFQYERSLYHESKAASEAGEEARVLYVAATRARDNLYSLRRGDLGKSRTLASTERDYAILSSRDVLVEVGIRGDVDDLVAVSTSLFPDAAAVARAQQYWWQLTVEPVMNCVDVTWDRQRRRCSIRSPEGNILLGGLSQDFVTDMHLLSNWLSRDISKLIGVPVRSVETAVITTPRDDVHMPYRQSGIYLTARLQGLVYAGKWSGR